MLIRFLLRPGLRDHWVLARLHSHLLPEGRTYFMCYVMSLMFVHDMHPTRALFLRLARIFHACRV